MKTVIFYITAATALSLLVLLNSCSSDSSPNLVSEWNGVSFPCDNTSDIEGRINYLRLYDDNTCVINNYSIDDNVTATASGTYTMAGTEISITASALLNGKIYESEYTDAVIDGDIMTGMYVITEDGFYFDSGCFTLTRSD